MAFGISKFNLTKLDLWTSSPWAGPDCWPCLPFPLRWWFGPEMATAPSTGKGNYPVLVPSVWAESEVIRSFPRFYFGWLGLVVQGYLSTICTRIFHHYRT